MSTLDIDKIPTAKEGEILSTVTEQQNGTIDETLIKNETKDDADVQVKSTSRTLALIKPDAMQANHKDEIISKIKENGFDLVQEKQLLLSKEKAGLFYKEHEGKPFYQDLTNWMSSAPIYALILEKQDAVQSWRNLMGPTNSNKARDVEPNSIRALFGTDGSQNATHGSDSQDSAEREIALIFDENKTHVVEIQGLVNEFNTHDVCKPDAIIEPEQQQQQQQQLPEVKTESNVGDNDTKNENNEKAEESIVDTEHLHTADLVTSQDNVTDLSQKEDETINAVPEEKVEINEITETPSATTVDNNKEEETIIDQEVVSLNAEIDATLQDFTAASDTADVAVAIVDIPTSDSNKSIPDTTQDHIKKHVADAVSSNDNKQVEIEKKEKQDTKPIESIPALEQQDAKIESEKVVVETEVVANVTANVADSEKETKENVADLEKETKENIADLEKETKENVAISGKEQPKANVDIENHVKAEVVETTAEPGVQEEPKVTENVKETEDLHENDAVLEPVASVTKEILEAQPIAIAVTVESNQEISKLDIKEPSIESLNADEPKKQDKPVIVNDINENSEKSIVDVDIVPVTAASTASVQENDESDIIPGVTTDAVPETKDMQSDVIADDDENKQPKAKDIETTLAEDETELIKGAKLDDSVIQEKQLEDEEVLSEQSGEPISTTPTTTTTVSSNDNSSQSSKNSSVTEKSQVQENKDKIKETNVNKKQPKLKAPGASSVGIRSTTRPTGSVVSDKKKATSTTATGLRKPATTTLKKKVDVKEQNQEEKPKTKTRVPRVALLSQPKKKPVQDATAAASTEVKTKKAAVSTRSLVSRLTAPTAASARKKTSSADGNTTTATATTKPADTVRQKKISSTTPTSTVKKASSSTGAAAAGASVTGTRASKMATKPTVPSSTAAGAAKKPTTTTGVRRISPPTSTTASKKVDGSVKRTTGTRARASGLPSSTTTPNGKTNTRKETLSTESKLKKTAPATTVKKSGAISSKTKADATSSTDSTSKASSASSASASSSSSLDNHAVVSEELESTKSETVSPPPSAPPVTDEIANEAEKLQENGLDNDNDNDSNNNINNVDQELNEEEIESDVIISSSVNVTGDEEKVTEKQDDIIVDLPKEETNNEQEVLSVDITKQQENVVVVEPATPVAATAAAATAANQESDAEVAAITTQPAITTNKPQMASLRSRFENINNNNNNTNNTLNNNQLHTTSSKEIRSKSPNRISDMINRFQ